MHIIRHQKNMSAEKNNFVVGPRDLGRALGWLTAINDELAQPHPQTPPPHPTTLLLGL